MKALRDVLLLTVRNDPESTLICKLAEQMGMAMLVSEQPVGARLDAEPNVIERVLATGKREVWIVEMPGPFTETALSEAGMTVTVIDHHRYGGEMSLDRTKDEDGTRLPSSLEQFLTLAGLSDAILEDWDLDPHLVRGIGIMDDRYARGLRDEGYSAEERAAVVAFRNQLARENYEHFDAEQAQAQVAWDGRLVEEGFIVVRSRAQTQAVRGAVGILSIAHDLDEHPLIVSDMNGAEIFVQNVDPSLSEALMAHVHGSTFTFGAGRCWGVSNQQGGTHHTVESILATIREIRAV